jgi:hypothetical protein
MLVLFGFLIVMAVIAVLFGIDWILDRFGISWGNFTSLIVGLLALVAISWLIGIIGCVFLPNLVPFCSAG